MIASRMLTLALMLGLGHAGAALAGTIPEDVEAFVATRAECDHFRGEPIEGDSPEMEERRAFVIARVEATCTGTDAALKTLRDTYANRPEVIEKLSQFEDSIEAPSDDVPTGPFLESGVYGPIIVGAHYDEGVFSGVLHIEGRPQCDLRFRGAIRFEGHMPARAQTRADAFAQGNDNETAVPATVFVGMDDTGTPTIKLSLERLPKGCPILAGFAAHRARPFSRSAEGDFRSIRWILTERAHFHDEAHDSTVRKAYVVSGDVIRGYRETAGFVESVYAGAGNRTTRGWINWGNILPDLWVDHGE